MSDVTVTLTEAERDFLIALADKLILTGYEASALAKLRAAAPASDPSIPSARRDYVAAFAELRERYHQYFDGVDPNELRHGDAAPGPLERLEAWLEQDVSLARVADIMRDGNGYSVTLALTVADRVVGSANRPTLAAAVEAALAQVEGGAE